MTSISIYNHEKGICFIFCGLMINQVNEIKDWIYMESLIILVLFMLIFPEQSLN